MPPRNVSLAVQLILGTKEAVQEAERGGLPRSAELPGIDGTLRDSIGLTNWPNYRLLASASFAAVEGEESMFALGEDYRIRLAVATVDPIRRVTRFDRFSLERAHADSSGRLDYRPIWDMVLNLPDRQLTVFGATRMEQSQRAIFLAITASIQE